MTKKKCATKKKQSIQQKKKSIQKPSKFQTPIKKEEVKLPQQVFDEEVISDISDHEEERIDDCVKSEPIEKVPTPTKKQATPVKPAKPNSKVHRQNPEDISDLLCSDVSSDEENQYAPLNMKIVAKRRNLFQINQKNRLSEKFDQDLSQGGSVKQWDFKINTALGGNQSRIRQVHKQNWDNFKLFLMRVRHLSRSYPDELISCLYFQCNGDLEMVERCLSLGYIDLNYFWSEWEDQALRESEDSKAFQDIKQKKGLVALDERFEFLESIPIDESLCETQYDADIL